MWAAVTGTAWQASTLKAAVRACAVAKRLLVNPSAAAVPSHLWQKGKVDVAILGLAGRGWGDNTARLSSRAAAA